MATKINKDDELYKKSVTADTTPVQSSSQGGAGSAGQVNTPATQNNRYTPSASVTAAQEYLKQVREGGYNKNYSAMLDSLVEQYMGRGAFEYDADTDALWQQTKGEGLRQSKMAMRDATAQAAALSGGYGNSYAATVGNQVYQQGVADTMALQSDYIQQAYERYKAEGDTMLNKIGLAQSMDESAYARYMDELSLAQSEADKLYEREYNEFSDAWNRDYQVGRDAVNDQWRNTEWQYQLDRDKVTDERYASDWQHMLDREAIEDQWRNTEWEHTLDREAIEDQQWQSQLDWNAEQNKLDREHSAAENAAERAWKASENQLDRNAAKAENDAQRDWEAEQNGYEAYYNEQMAAEKEANKEAENLKTAMQTPAYQDAIVALGGLSTDKQKTKLHEMFMDGDFGSGENAATIVELLALRFGIDPTELFADWY